jgi:phospholipid/cholesterol/gamma-HCH transport system substrate-binding protein
MRRNLIETVMGAVVLVVAAMFIVFAYSKAEVGTVNGYEINAKFDRIDGILAGSDVRMSGIKIGTVTSSVLDPKTYFAKVAMNIRTDVKVPDDTSIAVSSDGLLGDKFLALSPGGSDQMLPPGGEILTTQGSIDLMGLVGQMIFSQTDKEDDKGDKDGK